MAAAFGAGNYWDQPQAAFGVGGPSASNPYNLYNNGMNSQIDTPNAGVAAQEAAAKAAADAEIARLAQGGNDYWGTALQSQAAGQQYAVPGYQGASFGGGYAPPAAPPPVDPYTPRSFEDIQGMRGQNIGGGFNGSMGGSAALAPAGGGWQGDPGMMYAGGNPNFNEAGNGGAPLIDTYGPKSGPAYGGGNPYLDRMAGGMIGQANRNFQTNTLPALRYGSMAAGGFGGSRQGVIEANALNDFNQGLDNSLANLYGQDWTGAQNRGLQRYGMDQNYDLGLGGLGNQRYGMDQNFYTAQRGQDQSGAALGANLYSMGMNNEWNPLQNASNIYSPFSGMGTTSQNSQQGGGLLGGVGGALAGGSFGRQMGWW